MSSSRLSHSSLDRVGLNDADYDAIEAAVMETTRGRWFLTEYARRLRRAETETILAALDALGRQIQSQHGLAASYKASARFTTCLQVVIGTPSRPGEPPPRALSVPAPRQSLSSAAAPGVSSAMQGARPDLPRSDLLLDGPDTLDYSLLGKVA